MPYETRTLSMRLNNEQVERYLDDGYLIVEDVFTDQ